MIRPLVLARIKIAAGIAAGVVTVSGGIYAAGAAHGDAMAEIERLRERLERLERLPERIDRMSDRLVRVEAGVDAIRLYFQIPQPARSQP